MGLIEELEWGLGTGLAIAAPLGSLRAAVVRAGIAGASDEIQREIMDPFVSATVGDFPGQIRSKCPGFTKKGDKCKQWCLKVVDRSVASCRVHRGQRDVETSNGRASYVHPDCGESKTAVSGEEIDQFTGESAHTACAGRWRTWVWTSARLAPVRLSSPSPRRALRGWPCSCL